LAVGCEATDVLAVIDEGAREVADLLFRDEIFDAFFGFVVFGVFVDVTPSLEDTSDMGIDTEFWSLMDPCHANTGDMTADARHSLESIAVVGDVAVVFVDDGLSGVEDELDLLAGVADVAVFHPVHPGFLRPCVVFDGDEMFWGWIDQEEGFYCAKHGRFVGV